jgi:putative hydrolase of the HAD superfamily
MHESALDFSQIRWIAFDAVDTLIKPTPSVAAIYHAAGARHGSRLALEQISARFRLAFARAEEEGVLSCDCPAAEEPWHTCERRERLRWKSIVEAVLDDVVDQAACFDDLFVHFSRPSTWICFPDVEAALDELRNRGFRLAVSSNFDARLNSVMDGLPELEPIELRMISSEVGYRKPSGRFFESLLERTGCRPSEILFVGDNPRTDVAAAEAMGIPSLQIDRSTPQRQDLILRSLSEIVDLVDRAPSPHMPTPST